MRTSRLLVGAAAAVLLVAYAATPAGAVWDPGLGGPRATGPNTDLELTSTGAGQGVTGWIDPANRLSDPSVPYPTTDPGPPFTSSDESFAGVINATPIGGGTDLHMYCINILTSTFVGVGYELGDWTGANVNNVGFVARLLNDYFPNTALPGPRRRQPEGGGRPGRDLVLQRQLHPQDRPTPSTTQWPTS